MKKQFLLDTLSKIKPGIGNTDLVVQSFHFIFTPDILYSRGHGIVIGSKFESDIEGAVPAKELYQLLSKFPDDEITITQQNNELNISGKGRSAGIKLEQITDLSDKELEKRKRWKKLPSNFMEGLRFCLISVGKKLLDSVLSNIYVNGNFMESCDNFCLGSWKLKSEMEAILIPADAAEIMVAYELSEYFLQDNLVFFKDKNDTVLLMITTGHGEFPDLSKFIGGKGTEIKMPKEVVEILERASVILDKENDTVTIKIAQDNLEVSSNSNIGWFKEKKKVAYKGTPMEFMIIPKFLIEICNRQSSIEMQDRRLKFVGEDFIYCCVTKV